LFPEFGGDIIDHRTSKKYISFARQVRYVKNWKLFNMRDIWVNLFNVNVGLNGGGGWGSTTYPIQL